MTEKTTDIMNDKATEEMIKNINTKKEQLEKLLAGYGKAIISFSGGVDSTFLLAEAKRMLGSNVTAVTLRTPVFTEDESEFAEEFCNDNDIEHMIIDVDLLADDEFVSNKEDRCYTCKKLLFEQVLKAAFDMKIVNICEGSIADDDNDYRPGKKAIAELGVLSPMKEVGLTKEEIRYLSKDMNLPTWNKPSMACLASRFPYHTQIEKDKLKMVEEAEKYLMELKFYQVRVRIHGSIARIEVDPSDFERFLKRNIREQIDKKLKKLGFSYVSLDLKGYRTGSMNEPIL